jgi:hypothetical protein
MTVIQTLQQGGVHPFLNDKTKLEAYRTTSIFRGW